MTYCAVGQDCCFRTNLDTIGSSISYSTVAMVRIYKQTLAIDRLNALFADKPKPPNADQSTKGDNWQIEERKSPTDGSPQVVAANLIGDPVLILRCKDQTTEAAFCTK